MDWNLAGFSIRRVDVKRVRALPHLLALRSFAGLASLRDRHVWPSHDGIRRMRGTIWGVPIAMMQSAQADYRTHLILRPAKDVLPPAGGTGCFSQLVLWDGGVRRRWACRLVYLTRCLLILCMITDSSRARRRWPSAGRPAFGSPATRRRPFAGQLLSQRSRHESDPIKRQGGPFKTSTRSPGWLGFFSARHIFPFHPQCTLRSLSPRCPIRHSTWRAHYPTKELQPRAFEGK